MIYTKFGSEMAKQIMTKEGLARIYKLRQMLGGDVNRIIKVFEQEMKASIQNRKKK